MHTTANSASPSRGSPAERKPEPTARAGRGKLHLPSSSCAPSPFATQRGLFRPSLFVLLPPREAVHHPQRNARGFCCLVCFKRRHAVLQGSCAPVKRRKTMLEISLPHCRTSLSALGSRRGKKEARKNSSDPQDIFLPFFTIFQ